MLTHPFRAARRLILPTLLVFVAAAHAAAQQTPPPAQQSREHVVRTGDTLWDLARAYLLNAFLWPLIYDANRAVVENPHWIYPGERLVIPPYVPQPPSQPLGEPVQEPLGLVAQEPVQAADTATVIASLDLRRPVVPLGEYIAAPWLSATAQREVVGRVIRVVDPSASQDRLPSTLHPNDHVHVGALAGARQQGDTLMIVRFGRAVTGYGVLVEPLALLRVDSVTPTVLTAQVVRQYGDAKIGDVVLPLGALPSIGLGRGDQVVTGPEGELLQFLVPEPMHSTTDIGFISLGRNAGVGIGDEFSVYVPARTIDNERAERLPPTEVGTVRVIKVGENSSTVRVLSIANAGLRAGLPVRLVRKMP